MRLGRLGYVRKKGKKCASKLPSDFEDVKSKFLDCIHEVHWSAPLTCMWVIGQQ